MSTETQKFVHETQQERWMKYGANVALASLIVVVLAILVVYLSQRFDKRIDTTAAGLYSLKPQTVNIIKDNKQKIKLVSLYSGKIYSSKERRQIDSPYAPVVRDLLEEYARKGSNIEYQVIDPITQPTDSLVKEAVEKYGGAIGQYKTFIDDFAKTLEQLTQLTTAEAAKLANMQTDSFGNDDRGQMLATVVNTVKESIPTNLSRLKDQIARAMKQELPQYRDIVDVIKESMQTLDQRMQSLTQFGVQVKDQAEVPQALRDYLGGAKERFAEISKIAKEAIDKSNSLGELKVGDLQQAIKGQDIILVMGDTQWRAINFEQVFVTDTRDIASFIENQEVKPRFAGEQAITTAILGVTTAQKQKVVFIRPGGAPLTTPGFPPFQRGGPLSEIAANLKDYNYEVLEKDISGMWAMQARMQQQMPTEPEPSDEEIKDALWVVLDIPGDSGPSPELNTKLADHLKNGGSALVLAMPGSDALIEPLKDFGVTLLPDYTIVHEMPQGERPKSADWAIEVQQAPMVFVVNKYGDHMIAGPLQALDSFLVYATPVQTHLMDGVKQTPILPIPEYLKIWAERDSPSIRDEKVTFNPDGPNADLPGPLFAGAAAEKGNSRLIVLGGLQSFTNNILSAPDPDMLARGVLVTRFPGNAELFNNCVFWLTKMEPMIAISPSAMEISRIKPMSAGVLGAWRVGVLLILLPGLVLAAGIWMYFVRRD